MDIDLVFAGSWTWSS